MPPLIVAENTLISITVAVMVTGWLILKGFQSSKDESQDKSQKSLVGALNAHFWKTPLTILALDLLFFHEPNIHSALDICFFMVMIFFQIAGLMLLALEWRTLFPASRSAS